MDDLSSKKDAVYKVLKCRFRGNESKIYGLMVLIWHDKSSTLEGVHVAISRFTPVYEVDLKTSFKSLIEKIATFIFRGNVIKAMTEGLQASFKQTTYATNIKDLFRFFKNKNEERLHNIIKSIICRDIGDRNPLIEINRELLTEEEMITTMRTRSDGTSDSTQTAEKDSATIEFDMEEGINLITGQLVLSPMYGKPISEVSVGEEVYFKLLSSGQRAANVISDLGLQDEKTKEIRAIARPVRQIKSNGAKNQYGLLVEAAPGVMISCVEEGNFKVKTTAETVGTDQPKPAAAAESVTDTVQDAGTSQPRSSQTLPNASAERKRKNLEFNWLPIFGLLGIIALGFLTFIILFLFVLA